MSESKLTVAAANLSGAPTPSTGMCVAMGASRTNSNAGGDLWAIEPAQPCQEAATGFVMDVPLCWLHRTMLLAGRPVKFQAWAHEAFEGLKPVGKP